MAYLIPVERTESGITTSSQLLNNGPRLTSIQKKYGWKVIACARSISEEERREVISNWSAIDSVSKRINDVKLIAQ